MFGLTFNGTSALVPSGGGPSSGPLDTLLLVDVDPDGVVGAFGGLFAATDDATFEDVLVGEVATVSPGDDLVRLTLEDLDGTAAALFGASALVTLAGALGADAALLFGSGEAFAATVTVEEAVAPIPLPAPALLLAGALGSVAMLRRRRRVAGK
ncbi:MAG: hypothetical protein ACFBWO_12900 [Paracoccaceae bacterium]